MTKNITTSQCDIHDKQYNFWLRLLVTNPCLYTLSATKTQYYYISKKLTKPYRLRLDVFLSPRSPNKCGYQSFTICGLMDNEQNEALINQITYLFGSDYQRVHNRYDKDSYTFISNDKKCFNKEKPNESYMIKWFNKYVNKIMEILQ